MIKVRVKKIILLVMAILVITMAITACNSEKAGKNSEGISDVDHPRVEIEMQDGSKMAFELYPEFAPNTVENFIELSKSGFYDGLKFHRIVKDFMVQSGDPKGDGTGGSENQIEGEFAENGFAQNTLKHTKGVISMARRDEPNSASSQFFIMHGDNSFLDGKYAAFGKLIEGEETLDKIANIPVEKNSFTGKMSSPTVDVIIKKVTVVDNTKK